jgi:hypothetical protein
MKDNYFQEVLLPLHIKLQGLYEKVCGRLTSDNWKDKIYCMKCEEEREYADCRADCPSMCKCESRIRLPKTIDDSSPEAQKRSLIEMLERGTTVTKLLHGAFTWGRSICIVEKSGEEPQRFDGATPTEAILRALCYQEGVELCLTP